jgi:hypothetical protein
MLTPAGVKEVKETVKTGKLNNKEVNIINSLPERVLSAFFVLISFMTGDMAIFIITLGLLFNDVFLFLQIGTLYGFIIVSLTVIYRQFLLKHYAEKNI